VNATIFFMAAACLGILVQSTVGFAGALLAIPLMTLFIRPQEAVPSYTLVGLCISVALVIEARKSLNPGLVSRMAAGGVVGTVLGSYALAHLPTGVLRVVICGVTLVFGLLFLLRIPVKVGEHRLAESGVGLLSGLFGGSTSMSGPPVVILGLSRGWEKEKFRANLLAYFAALNAVAIISYWRLGLLGRGNLMVAMLTLVPAAAASLVGVWLKNRVGEDHFRVGVLAVILLVSLIGLVPSHLFAHR
jgi:uncharacterized membrane protein YfcA